MQGQLERILYPDDLERLGEGHPSSQNRRIARGTYPPKDAIGPDGRLGWWESTIAKHRAERQVNPRFMEAARRALEGRERKRASRALGIESGG